jgi:ubiquitin-associated SH3 domain-containing protein
MSWVLSVEGGNILIVGHAATLEVCTRQITGQQIRTYSEFNSIIRKVSYLGNCLLNKKPDQAFEILATGVNPLSHGATFNFDSMSLKA